MKLKLSVEGKMEIKDLSVEGMSRVNLYEIEGGGYSEDRQTERSMDR